MKETDSSKIKAIKIPLGNEYEQYGYSMDNWEFKVTSENGEMALITYIEVWKNHKKILYTKLSNCIIYFY